MTFRRRKSCSILVSRKELDEDPIFESERLETVHFILTMVSFEHEEVSSNKSVIFNRVCPSISSLDQ